MGSQEGADSAIPRAQRLRDKLQPTPCARHARVMHECHGRLQVTDACLGGLARCKNGRRALLQNETPILSFLALARFQIYAVFCLQNSKRLSVPTDPASFVIAPLC